MGYLKSLLSKESQGYTSFSLERPKSGDEPAAFVAHESYFEVRVAQMFLRYERQYWRTFIPVTSTLVEFSLAGQRRMVPFVVGPQLLSTVKHVDGQDRIEFANRRVAGPQPYEGEDVTIFGGLFRMESGNWAKQALLLAEMVVKTFDVSRLTSYVNMAGPLVDALQAMLGMKDVELRLGLDRSYARAGDMADDGRFAPRYEVITVPDEPIDKTEFSVRDGRLCRGDKEFRDGDFLLLEIAPSATRNDYAMFPFHTAHWKKIVSYAWDGQERKAWDRFRMLAGELAACEDIVAPQRGALFEFYKDELESELARFRETQAPGGEAFAGDVTPKEQIPEAELQRAARTPSGASKLAAVTPEEFLAAI